MLTSSKTGLFGMVLSAALFLVGCAEPENPTTTTTTSSSSTADTPEVDAYKGFIANLSGAAQGTTYHITYLTDDSLDLNPQIKQLLKNFDQSLSLWEPNSLINTMNEPFIGALVIRDTFGFMEEVLRLSKEVYATTQGDFDPSVYPLVEAWGFGANPSMPMDSAVVDSLMQFVGFDKIEYNKDEGLDGTTYMAYLKADPRTRLDFNALAQGYSVDAVCELLELSNIDRYMVEIGGELRCKGQNSYGMPWKIQLDKPVEGSNAHELFEMLNIVDKAVATSGNYRKQKEIDGVKYSHTINPHTGFPVKSRLLSVTVIADDAGTADAYATAFMVAGIDKTKTLLDSGSLPELEVYLIYSEENGDLATWMSEGMKAIVVEKPAS